MVYRTKQPMNIELCWATLNLLRRYTDFAKVYEEFGRYYLEQYDALIVSMTKVLNYDLSVSNNLYSCSTRKQKHLSKEKRSASTQSLKPEIST